MTNGAAWSIPSLRTDSVNRGFCISLVTSEMIFRAISSRLFFFFIININTVALRICSQWLTAPFRQKMSIQAFVGSDPESGPIFVTSNTSSNVAV